MSWFSPMSQEFHCLETIVKLVRVIWWQQLIPFCLCDFLKNKEYINVLLPLSLGYKIVAELGRLKTFFKRKKIFYLIYGFEKFEYVFFFDWSVKIKLMSGVLNNTISDLAGYIRQTVLVDGNIASTSSIKLQQISR